MKKEKGLGTLSLVLGLLPSLLTATYNGTSLLKLAIDALSITYSPYMAAFGFVLSIPGLIIGIRHKDDWGAKFGIFCCAANFVLTVVQLIMEYMG